MCSLMRASRAARTDSARPRSRRGLSIRSLLILLTVVPSLALVALWGFTSLGLVQNARALDNETMLVRKAGLPGYNLMVELQKERRLTGAWLARPSPATVEALRTQRGRTDTSVALFARIANSGAKETLGHAVRQAHSASAALGGLADLRSEVDAGGGERDRLLGFYTARVEDQIALFRALSQTSDPDMTFMGQALVIQFRAVEASAREDQIVTYAQGTGRISRADLSEFTQLVGVRRHTYTEQVEPYLPKELRSAFTALTEGRSWMNLVETEDALIASAGIAPAASRNGIALPMEAATWRTTVDRLDGEIAGFSYTRTRRAIAIGDGIKSDTWQHVYLLTGVGFVFVALGALLCWRVTRSVRSRLSRLRDATVDLGTRRLPDIVDRLQRGERVDVAAEAPDVEAGSDEIGQVAAAFNTAQRAAVEGAVLLARQREGFTKVFVNTALRTQSLVNRQIGELDAMERRHQEPELLRELFTIDHLATRLRRYEENLVVLTGNRPGRRWSRAVRVVDVVRSAIGEVEDYHRVEVQADLDPRLTGPAVGGMIHLLAELIENATMFAPPETPVHVRAVTVAKGLAIEVEDRGLGMSDGEYDTLNRQLVTPVPFDVIALAEDVRLGLFVVAQLAERLGVAVTLRSSPYGGTLAIVFIPEDLITRGAAEPLEPPPPRAPFELAKASETAQAGDPADDRGYDPAGTGESVGTDPSKPESDHESGGRPQPEPVVRPFRSLRPEPVVPEAESSDPDEGTVADTRRALPRRVRRADLSVSLRGEPAGSDSGGAPGPDARPDTEPREAAATLSAFRVASQRARDRADDDPYPAGGGDAESADEGAPGGDGATKSASTSESASEPTRKPAPSGTTHPGETS